MNGQRAMEILNGFVQGQLAFTAQEIDELIKAQLVVEANPADYKALEWLATAMGDLGLQYGDPDAVAKLEAEYAALDERLKSDWHRFTTTKKHIDEEEQKRRAIRRVLPHLKDADEMARLAKITPGIPYRKCAALGDELYALTERGQRVIPALAQRFERYKDYPFAAFLKGFDKTDAKMAAFAGEISTLSGSIGFVKKNPHQVVIGLAKTGQPAAEALRAYHSGVKMTGAPDVAVTLARGAASYGGADNMTARLHQAVGLLQAAGFPRTPVTFGAAKSLLPFEPMQDGVQRFNQISTKLQQQRSMTCTGEVNVKATARLMSADGAPEDVVRRAVMAHRALHQSPSNFRTRGDELFNSVALASMVKSDDQVPILVARFRAVEAELVRMQVSNPQTADADALECVSCPGTPTEVAATVSELMGQIAAKQGRRPQRGDVAIAVAFAKRFAY